MRSFLIHFHDSRKRRWIEARRDGADGEAGLTLVEMIVVLAIIALIAALIVPNVINRPDQARVTVANSDIRTISAALKMYRLDSGDYPTTEQGLRALVEVPGGGRERYLDEVPVDPWGRAYVYRSPAGSGFELLSYGKDGKPGGEGLNADISGQRQGAAR